MFLPNFPNCSYFSVVLGKYVLVWLPPRKNAVYVENIFRDNFLRFSPPLQAKTVEKPTFFNIAKVQFCAAEGPETL